MKLDPYSLPFYTDDFLIDVMDIEKWPTFLYHYTSINTLALILKNQTIRFNRLDKVNDPEEAISKDLQNSNTTQFVSCWTANQRESIPLWNMYTKMKGVRIGMPTDMFEGRPTPDIYDHGGAMIHLNEAYNIERKASKLPDQLKAMQRLISPEKIPSNGSKSSKNKPSVRLTGISLPFSVWSSIVIGPNPVFYSDEERYHHPNILFDAGDPYNDGIQHVGISPIDLGSIKGEHWKFEQEWRFKISMFGIGETFPLDEIGKARLDLLKYPVITEYIDVDLDEGVFDQMEVTLAPSTTMSEQIIIESLLHRFAPKAVLKRSELNVM